MRMMMIRAMKLYTPAMAVEILIAANKLRISY